MKKRVIAWLTAAAMLLTSVPANAMEVLVEEAPQILAEEVQEDAPVVSEAVPDPVVVSDAVPEAAEYTEDVSEEILTLESPDETEAEVISAEDADSLDGLVEDFTVEEDLQEPDAFVEEEIIPEETEAEEVLIAAEEGETTGSEVTDISLSFGNPAGVFTPGAGTFLYSLMSLISNGRSTVTTSGAGRQYCWFYIDYTPVTIDHKNVYIMRDSTSSRIGLLPYDAQTNELIANDSQIWTSIPNGRSVKIVPFELDSQDYDKWADRAVTLAFPELDPSALPLTDGSAVSVGGSSRQWYEYTGSDDNKRTVSLTADGSFTGDMRLLSFSQSEDAVFQNTGVTSFKDSFAFPYTFGPNRRYYLYVENNGDKAVNLSIDTVSNLETVTLPDVNVSTYELTHMSYQSDFFGLFSVQAAYADGKTYGPRSDSAAWSGTDGDGNRYLSVNLASGDTATVRFLDEDGNTTDLDIYNYALLTPGSYRMRAEIAAYDIDTGSYRTIYSDPAVLTVTATPPSATELGCDAAAGFSAARRQTAYFSPVVETSGSYRFTLTGSTQGWNTLIAELSKVNPDNTYTSILYTSFYFYEEEMSNSFTADLEEGTAYLLSLRMPNGDGVTIDGTIQFTANGSGSADSEIIKETIAAGETKTAVWPADAQTQYEYTFVPEESGNYRIFSEGGADTYVTLYSSEGEVREHLSEDDDDGEGTNFSLRNYLEAGKTYIYVARPYGFGDGSSSLITLERCYGIETAELTFSGTSEPRFVEGLYFDGAAAPLWALGEVTATFTYEDNSSEQIVISSGDEIITKNGEAYQIYSVAGFDENGEPVGLSEYGGPAAGSWYAVLASSEWDGEEDRYTYTFVPSQKQEGDWKPSLETVSVVPFNVLTKQEAASGVSLQDNGRAYFDQGNTYYVGMTVTTEQSGEVTLSSDLAMSTVRVFGPSEENPAVLSEVSVSLKDEYTARMKLDAGTEYYVFVRPSAATRFTVESVRLVSLTGAVLTTDLPSTITTQRVVRTEDFGVDLTYDDDSTVHLTGAQSDAYGNSFFYRAESDTEGYGYQFRFAGDGTTMGADRYTVSGQMNVTGSYITTGSYIATASDVVTDNTVSLEVVRQSGSNTVSTGSVETIATGNTAQFTFVPEEDGYYTILGNGDPLICELDYEGRSPVDFDGATYYLYANTTYYIDVPVSANDQDISVTRRFPVTLTDENPTLSVRTQAGRNTQFLFTVEETGVYDLSVAAPAESEGLSLYLFCQKNRYSAGLQSSRYETNNPAVIPVILKAGTIYLLNSHMLAENSSEDVFDLALTAEKRSSDTGVQVRLNAADSLNYPAIFAEDLLRGAGVQETAGGSTTIVPFESPSEVTGYNYYWLGISGAGDTRTVRFESEGPNEDYKTHSKEITFTGDLGSAPNLTENTVCNTGVEMERTWFYRFTPEKTAYYHVAVECPGSGYYVIREEETGRAVSSDSPRLTEGKAYIIAAFYESASESPAVTVRSIVNIDSVEIVNAPESVLLQNLSSRTGFSVKLSYSDGTESTYDLAMNNADRQGYAITLAGYVLPVRAGETKKARVRVSAGGRQDYCDIPLGSSGTNTITENLQDAAALSASDESLWYRFTPSADAYYETVLYAGDTSGYGYSWEVYAENSTVPMSSPAYLKQGNTYIVCIMVRGTVSDLQAAMLRKGNASSSSLVSLTYEYAAEDGTTELPAEVTSLAPAGTQLMKDSEVKVAAPGETVVRTSDATYTFLGYDYAGEIIRLYEDTTIVGTWAVDPVRSYKVSYRFENGNEQDGLSLPEAVTALTPKDVWYEEGASVTIQNPARTEVTTEQGYWSFNGYDKADFTMGTADVAITGTWTYSTEEHQVNYVFSSNSGIPLPEEVMNLCPDPETAVKGTMVIPHRPASEAVTVPGQGIWYFGGYTPSSAKMRRANLTFTGYWTYEEFASSEITVTFNGGEGSAVRSSYDSEGKPVYGEGTTYSETVAAGDTVTLAGDLFYREGYQIRSWTDGSGNTYPADADQAFTESVVLTANWKAEGEQECIHENMVHHPRVEATCTEDGNIEYYECPDCEKKFSDAAGEEEITGSVILPASGHGMTYHQAVEATCTEAGNIAYYECANCGRKFSDEAGEEEITGSVIVTAHGHSMTYHQAVEETCTEDGSIAYYECANCGRKFSDAAGEEEITGSVIVSAHGHSMTYHQAVEETCTEDGSIAYYECANCGRKFSDEAGEEEITGSVIVSAHGHSMTYHQAVEPTSTEDGNIEYYECSNCGKFFSDLEGIDELDSSSIIRPKVEAVPGEYTVTYKFVCESGEELPDSILALCPTPETYYTEEWVEVTYPAKQKVDVGNLIWNFYGYDIEDFQMGMADVTVTGTWTYRPKTDSEIAADALANLSDGSDSMDPNDIVDLLENANSSEILGRLEETLGEEPGNDEDGLNDALAQTTAALDEQLVDDSDAPDESKKITVSSGSQTTGAYVGNTSTGQTGDGVSVAISGAAATVASVIRSQDVDKLAENENRHYQAVVSVDVVEKQNDSLTLDISLDVKVAETGQVVENDIDPVSPVTVTITLPDEYVGYDLTVIHTTRSGETEEVSYSFINEGKQIRFTVSSLSPFELQILECMHSNLTPVIGLIATCAMDGRRGHWVCGTCGKKFLDEDCEQEVTDAQLVIPKSTYHTWNSTVTVAATEDTTGVMTHTCAVCGQSWTEVIPKTPVNITISKKPSKFKAKAEKKGKVTLTWTKLANKGKTKALYKQVKNIEIQYSTDSIFATGVTKKILSKKKAKYSVKLSKNTKYYFRIRYCDGNGGYSNWVVKSVKTKKK